MRSSEVVRDLLARFKAGDLQGASELLDASVRVVVLGEHALAGTYTGRDAWRRYAEALRGVGDGSYHVSEVERLDGSAYCALVLRASVDGTKGASAVTWRRLVTYHVENDRVTELWLTDLDSDAAVAAYATVTTTMGEPTP